LASFSAEKNQNKRRVNYPLMLLIASGVSQRRAAIILKVTRKTVARKFQFLAMECKRKNRLWLEQTYLNHKVKEAQFDDLITIEHTKLKPLSVSTIVDKNTMKILGTKVSQIGAFGHLAQLSRKKYGKRKNNHKEKISDLFNETKKYIHPFAKFESDEHRTYPIIVKKYFPQATHLRYKGGRGAIAGQGELKKLRFDPLFAINHTYAMFRANINRLFRKTWNTTKTISQLQNHLEIYTYAFNLGLISSK